MTARRRIAVTGAGLVCALGATRREAWEKISEGECGIGAATILCDPGYPVRIAAEASLPSGIPPAGGRRRIRHASRTDLLCLFAAREALEAAGWLDPGGGVSPGIAEFGASLGSTTGGMLEAEDLVLEGRRRGGYHLASSRGIRTSPCLHPASALVRWAGLSGPTLSNTTACSSGVWAVALAADLIRRGEAPGMIAGGADGICRLTLSGFGSLKALDPDPCRPFDAGRQGLSLGEGAGILVLEDWEIARKRGSPILAEFLDYGSSCDATHLTASDPNGEGASAAIRTALLRSGIDPSDVDYINAHGTGTPINDASETAAIRAVFGRRAPEVPVSSTKSLLGHGLGAAGGMEAVVTVTAIETQTLPPTLGFRSGEPGFDLDVVPGKARPSRIRVAISNNFGFGGGNTTLVFRRAEPS